MEGVNAEVGVGGEPGRVARVVVGAVVGAGDARAAMERAWEEPGAGPVLLVAFGKASAEMAGWAAARLGGGLAGGVVVGVPGRVGAASVPGCVERFEADHPLPTERNVRAAERLREVVSAFARRADGTVVCLISGGGSAHLTLPAGRLALEDLRRVNGALQRQGAPIEELNCVRKHTEELKGGGLARLAAPARVDAYVLSDVMGDRLDVIASGPVTPDPTTFAGAREVMARRGCVGVSAAVDEHLARGAAGEIGETPKPGEKVFENVRSTVIAGNGAAVEAVRKALVGAGLSVVSVETGAEGEASEVGKRLGRTMSSGVRGAWEAGGRPVVWIVGGEWTVRVGDGEGVGGPSQELALACAIELERAGLGARAGVVSFSSDGVDGPTDAAGAALTGGDVERALAEGMDLGRMLGEHDSHTALARMGALIRTGPTGTNVNHVAVGVVWG